MKNCFIITMLVSCLVPISVSFADDEIQTKDLENKNISSSNIISSPNESISPEQVIQLQKQMQDLKANQEKAQKYLEELNQE